MDPLQALENAVATAAQPTARVRALNALSTELARTGQGKRAFALAEECLSAAIVRSVSRKTSIG